MMTDFVRDDVSLREISGRSEALAQLAVEAEIDVDPAVARAVKGSGRRLGEAACGFHRVAEEHQVRVFVGFSQRRQNPTPHRLDVVQHEGNELHHRLFRPVLDRRLLTGPVLRARLGSSILGGEETEEVGLENEAQEEQHQESTQPKATA
jgi:hypothetical protein